MKDIKTFSRNTDSSLDMTIGSQVTEVTGIDKLAQMIVNIILTETGSDTFNPDIGTSVKALATKISSDKSSLEEANRILAIDIVKIEAYIKKSQGNSELPDSEKLLSLKVLQSSYNVTLSEWTLSLLVTSLSSETTVINID